MGNSSNENPLYTDYLDTHFGHFKDVSIDGIENSIPALDHYYGELLPVENTSLILDIGCGFGNFVHYLNKKGYKNVVGVDVSPQQVETAESLGIPNVKCAEAGEFLSSKVSFYDCIIAIDLLDHLPKDDVVEFIQLMYASLKPGGRLIIQVVNGQSPFSGRLRYGDFTHQFALTSSSAGQLMRIAGFSKFQFYDTSPYPHGVKSFIRWLGWQVVKFGLWSITVMETGNTKGNILTQNLIILAEK